MCSALLLTAATAAARAACGAGAGASLFAACSRRQLATTTAAAAGSSEYPMLLRDFIRHSLYHPELGYFSRARPPLARLPAPIEFNRLVGRSEYRAVLARLHTELEADWLTPAEVFRPWYGRAVARWALEERAHRLARGGREPLLVVEVGGGTGTLAATILDHVASVDPVTYSSMAYACVEISERLSSLQADTVRRAAQGHADRFVPVVGDAASPAAWRALDAALPPQHRRGAHAFVVATEVLDNLPHDRCVPVEGRGGSGSGSSDEGGWLEAVVRRPPSSGHHKAAAADCSSSAETRATNTAAAAAKQEEGEPPWIEDARPLADPLVARALCAALGSGGAPQEAGRLPSAAAHLKRHRRSWLARLLQGGGGAAAAEEAAAAVYVPTGALALLDALHAARPRHSLLAADFDALPDVVLPGLNAPLVSGRAAPGAPRDYGTLLVPWGAADIFFPTDFDAFGRLYEGAAAAAAAGAGADAGAPQQQQSARHASWRHVSTAEFVQALGFARHTATLSGWNPLLSDWPNTRVFLGSAGPP